MTHSYVYKHQGHQQEFKPRSSRWKDYTPLLEPRNAYCSCECLESAITLFIYIAMAHRGPNYNHVPAVLDPEQKHEKMWALEEVMRYRSWAIFPTHNLPPQRLVNYLKS